MIKAEKNGDGKLKFHFDLSGFIQIITVVAAILIFYYSQVDEIKKYIAENRTKIEVNSTNITHNKDAVCELRTMVFKK